MKRIDLILAETGGYIPLDTDSRLIFHLSDNVQARVVKRKNT